MLKVEDPDGFVDRQLFDFPPDSDVYLDDLKVPIPSDVPRLVDVLKVRTMTEEIDGHMFSKSSAVHYLLLLTVT